MQILLSPAKDMTDSPSVSLPSLTTPLFFGGSRTQCSADERTDDGRIVAVAQNQSAACSPQQAAIHRFSCPHSTSCGAFLHGNGVSSSACCRVFVRRPSLCSATPLDDVFSIWFDPSTRWYQKLSSRRKRGFA